MPSEKICQVPESAFHFEQGPLQFAAGEPADKPRAKISMLARTGEAITHWYWGRIIHDMQGMRLRKDSAPIDWCHRQDEIIGVLNEFKATNKGLEVAGELVAFREDDRAAEVIFKGQAGIPYEASLDWSGPGTRIEEIGEGVAVTVNGRKFEGPGYVVREWPLRSVAVCPYGADPKTQSRFQEADEAKELAVTIFTESDMGVKEPGKQPTEATQQTEQPAKNPSPAPTQQSEKTPTPAPAPTQQSEPPPAAGGREAFTAELKRFTDRFGVENGTKWFTEGKTFDAAMQLHAESLEKLLSDKDTKLAEQAQKLAAAPRGEPDPVTFSDADKNPKGEQAKFAGLGSNIAKVAGGMKFRDK